MAGHFDATQPSNAPRRTFGQKALRFLRGLVIRPREDGASSQALSNTQPEQRQDAPR
jgi:hypothetical protein